MVAFMAVVALAVDGGAVQRERRLLQNAADAGALAGAWEIYRNHNTDSAVFANALAETARNGYTNGVNNAVVTASRPTSPDYLTGSQYIKVVVQKTISTPFSAIIGRSSATVTARAWGGIISPSRNCLVSLASSGYGLHMQNSGTTVDADNCAFRLNSSSSNALELESGTSLDMNGGSISITGPTPRPPGITPASVTYTTGVAPLPDPFGTVVAPTGFSTTCDAAHTNRSINSGTVTLNPGVYCGGLEVKSGAVVTLTEGLYIFLGGGMNIQNNGTTLTNTGAGITIYNTYDASHPYVRMRTQSGTTVNLYADPNGTNGTIAGILWFGDRTVTNPSGEGFLPSKANEIQSGTGIVLSGALYFPTQDIRIQDATSVVTINNGSIIANRIWIQSGVDVVFNGGGGGGGTGFFGTQRPSVVE
jgi:hypothetical protein